MMRPPFVGHRRYSITHRAVQRLRELVPGRDDEDDEALRDTLDVALGEAEDGGRAIRTLDAMLGEPQTLIPVDTFGDLLYAIIKEDTVVTVLPQGHGEEILHRGQVMEQRVASGQASVRPAEPREEERWEGHRRRWRKDGNAGVVIERIGRVATNGYADEGLAGETGEDRLYDDPLDEGVRERDLQDQESPGVERLARDRPVHDRQGQLALPVEDDNDEDDEENLAFADVAPLPAEDLDPSSAEDPLVSALRAALEVGRRRAAVSAIREMLAQHDPDEALLPLWNAMAEHRLPQTLTLGDLVSAVRGRSPS